jgi:hypothetical protein
MALVALPAPPSPPVPEPELMALVALPAPPSPPVPEPELVVLVVLVVLVALADEPETATGFAGSVVSQAAMPNAPTTAMDHAAL